MSRATLGDFLDIHTGGIDHISVHHTNEIAQSECGFTHGKKRVNYWMHCQFLNIDNAKIAKSVGNVFSLPDIIAKWFDALDLRYFYFQAQYRSFQDFTREGLEAAKKGRKNLIQKIQKCIVWYTGSVDESIVSANADALLKELENEYIAEMFDSIMKAICDDLDLQHAMAIVHQNITEIAKKEVNYDSEELYIILYWLEKNILKLWLFDVEENIDIPANIQSLAQQRRDAKQSKDFATADKLRKKLHDTGREMVDGKEGFEIVPKAKS